MDISGLIITSGRLRNYYRIKIIAVKIIVLACAGKVSLAEIGKTA
jgi:hypothetical protein